MEKFQMFLHVLRKINIFLKVGCQINLFKVLLLKLTFVVMHRPKLLLWKKNWMQRGT